MQIVPSMPEAKKPIKVSYARSLLSWFGFVLFLVGLFVTLYAFFEQQGASKLNNNLQYLYWGLSLEVYCYIGLTFLGFVITVLFSPQVDSTYLNTPYVLHTKENE